MSKTLDPALIWNGWSNNYRPREDGYRIHACLEVKGGIPRALCGVRMADSGLLNLKDGEFEPSCFHCRDILRKAGLLKV